MATTGPSLNLSQRQDDPTLIRNRTKSNISRNSFRSRQPPVIDLSDIEIVDLTEPTPPRPPRRPSDSPTSERPAKRVKGKDPEVYISLDDEDEASPSLSPLGSPHARHHKPPPESGSLSQAKCVICLDSPTDLIATPCGTISTFIQVTDDRAFVL